MEDNILKNKLCSTNVGANKLPARQIAMIFGICTDKINYTGMYAVGG
jgi:hypothetical protein